MRDNEALLQAEDRWVTALGAFFPGDRVVYRGKDLFNDLKDKSWMGVLAYGVTGREFSDEQLMLFEKLWILAVSYPDPRLWNNRIAALAGTAKSTAALGASAAIAVSEATIYGFRAALKTIDFLIQTRRRIEQGAELEDLVKAEFKKHRSIYGFGRPLTVRDERIEPVMAIASELGLADGVYIKLAFAIEEVIKEGRWRLQMNIAAVSAALSADQGLSAKECYYMLLPSFSAGIIPCYIDAEDSPEATFFPLRCETIYYQGPERRSW